MRNSARRGWNGAILLGLPDEVGASQEGINLQENAEGIVGFATSLILQTDAPAQNEDNDEPSLRQTQSILAISYILQTLPAPLTLSDSALAILTSADMWELVSTEQPAMLRRAIYELLGSMVERKEDLVSDGLQTIAGWVLRNCWGETDGWAGIIAFLRRESFVSV